MLKRVLLCLLIVAFVVSFAGCCASDTLVRPEGWDEEAEALRFCNGYIRAKTVEELKPYVVSKTSDEQLKSYMDKVNASREPLQQEGTLYYWDYPFDAVEVTLLETYKNYEILWLEVSSSAILQAHEEQLANGPGMIALSYTQIGPILIAVTIENGHYVASLDESLSQEINGKYGYCLDCRGMGGFQFDGFGCTDCMGWGYNTSCICRDCNTQWKGDAWEMDSLYAGEILVICPDCRGTNVVMEQQTCEICKGRGSMESEWIDCTSCDGKGWFKR